MLSYIKKNDGVTVALLTASCYVAAYFFEAGYAHHFGIPAELISITLGNIISTSIFLFFATIIAFFACTFPYHIVDRFFGKNIIAILSSIALSLVVFALLITYLLDEITKSSIITAVFAWITLTFGFYLWIDPDTTSSQVQKNQTLLSKIQDITGVFFWLSFPCIIFIMSCGTYSARHQTKFDTFEVKKTEYAILKIYGDNIIAKKAIDNKVSDGIYIFKTENLGEVKIITRNK